jgi:DNA-directed RNA polymerase specialized sigma24 family protein
MKIPDGMTEKEVVELIKKVAKRLAPKYVFGFFTKEDLEQEAFIMGMDALKRYDSSRPLENFLSVHISNRLKSFLRDNYFRQLPPCECKDNTCSVCESKLKRILSKKNIMAPIDLGSVCDEKENSMKYADFLYKKLEISEIKELVNKYLPLEYRIDFKKMCDGVSIPKPRKDKIKELIEEILHDYTEE